MADSSDDFNFQLIEGEEMAATLSRYEKHLQERTAHHLGYPYTLSYDYSELAPLSRYSINNLGDPFNTSNYGVHSRAFEIATLNYFSDLWNLPREEMWGYVTCSGTEGNLSAVWSARETLPQAPLFCSRETHYSIAKACRMFRIEHKETNTLHTGEIDYDDLERALRASWAAGFFSAIVVVNVGTTVKGGVDDVARVVKILHDVGFSDEQFYIHVDGALFGMLLPFLEGFDDSPHLSFELPITSISVSGHKFIGSPVCCGVIIYREATIRKADALEIEYLASTDTCIMGSRNGHAAIYMWKAIVTKGTAGFAAEAKECLINARKLVERLRKDGIGCLLNPLSNTVVLERPLDPNFVLKWQLACVGTIAHVVVMPSTTEAKLMTFADEFMEQFKANGSKNQCIKAHVGPGSCVCPACA